MKVICFDLDGVYFTGRGKKEFQKALTALTNNPLLVEEFLFKSEIMRNFGLGIINTEEFWDQTRDFLKLNISNQEFEELWAKGYEIDEEVRKFVLECKSKGYKTCICSNNNPVRVQALNEKFNFLEDFDIAVFSYEVGFYKPAKEIFQELINRAYVNPSEIIYADDNPDRILGAKELGINAFVFENFEQFKKTLRENFGV